ncbi:unnamed protein product, partial [Rotaria socialis]
MDGFKSTEKSEDNDNNISQQTGQIIYWDISSIDYRKGKMAPQRPPISLNSRVPPHISSLPSIMIEGATGGNGINIDVNGQNPSNVTIITHALEENCMTHILPLYPNNGENEITIESPTNSIPICGSTQKNNLNGSIIIVENG